jgi:hypothetical protein
MPLSTQEVLDILNTDVLDPAILEAKCPLDHGLQGTLTPSEDLGDFDKVPLEIQHVIVGVMDVASVLVFRRINRKARIVVDGMLEWQKVGIGTLSSVIWGKARSDKANWAQIVQHAPNAIRMAVCLRTASQVSIIQLCDLLCQRNWSFCFREAPYIDMFSVARRCLLLRLPHHPLHASSPIAGWDPTTQIRNPASDPSIPSFEAIPAMYSDMESFARETYYALPIGQQRITAGHPGTFFSTHDGRRITNIVAPWLKPNSMEAEAVVVCQPCEDRHSSYSTYRPNSVIQPFRRGRFISRLYTADELKEHPEQEHSE